MSKLNFKFVIFLVLILISSCSSKNKIGVEIPQELKENKEVVSFLNEYASTYDKLLSLTKKMNPVLENAEEEKVSKNDQLKFTSITLEFSRLSSRLHKLKNQRQLIYQTLSEKEKIAFLSSCKEIEGGIQKMGFEIAGIDNLKTNQVASDSVHKKNEVNLLSQEEQSLDFSEAINETKLTNRVPYWHFLFPIAVFGLFIFFWIRKIKGTVSRFKETKDKVMNIRSEVRYQIRNAKTTLDERKGEMTEEQIKETEKIFDVLDDFSKR